MSADDKFDFKELLEESVKIHGHLCPGQVLGVRMGILGLKLTGINDPKGKDRKKKINISARQRHIRLCRMMNCLNGRK